MNFVEISESVEVSRGSEILRFLESTKSGLFKSGLGFFISHFVRFLVPKVLKPLFSITHDKIERNLTAKVAALFAFNQVSNKKCS